ncbi:hypothetical protein [Streptomyces sp. NPDC050564]|uniref:hypothetical protein n=1 Tax=Streptomyces sp. NPDC050564 TaxID=3365631 RepID=UPI00379FEE7B
MSKLHVGYVRKAIEERFTDLIDMSDQARPGLGGLRKPITLQQGSPPRVRRSRPDFTLDRIYAGVSIARWVH